MFQKHQKSLRCPRHGYGFFKSLSWSCGISTSELKQITGSYHFFAAKTRKTARVPPHLACPDDLNKRWFPGDYHTFLGGYDGDIMGYTTNNID